MTAALELVRDEPTVREWAWWLKDLEAAVGPIVGGRVYVIGARPSCGKTAVLMNLFWQLARAMGSGSQCDILSCWTERSQIAALTSLFALVEGLDEDLTLRGAWDRLPAGAQGSMDIHLRQVKHFQEFYPILDTACPTSDQILEALEKHRPTVFLLDYLQKIRPAGRQSTFDAWHATMTHCTQYAADGGTVIIGSQLKRKGDGVFDKYRPPFMEDFKGGGVIEEGANLALGLYRPLRKMTNAEEREVKAGRDDLSKWQQPGVMAIKVLKHTFWGSAADRIVRVRVSTSRRILDYRSTDLPADVGDAYEEVALPF